MSDLGATLSLMTYEETIEALAELEGQAVEIDFVIVRAASGTRPGLHRSNQPGVLRRQEGWEIYEFWWTLPEATHYEVAPDGGMMIQRDRFEGARWEGSVLDIHLGSHRWRVVPLIRAV
jgi:hypothetical protein